MDGWRLVPDIAAAVDEGRKYIKQTLFASCSRSSLALSAHFCQKSGSSILRSEEPSATKLAWKGGCVGVSVCWEGETCHSNTMFL